MLERDCPVNATVPRGFSPLHFALWQAPYDLTLVARLLEHGAVVNYRSSRGETPLLHILKGGWKPSSARERKSVLDAARLLVEHGADTAISGGMNDITASELAASWGYVELFEFLPFVHPDALGCAARSGQLEVMEALLRMGHSMDRLDARFGWSPLHGAIELGKHGAIELLVERGCDVNLRNRSGRSPLYLAIKSGNRNSPIVQLLVRAGADIGETVQYKKAAVSIVEYCRLRGLDRLHDVLQRAQAGAD